jgi:DNA-binding SARP family transcriptional activator/Tfp pilus assembly protein PilF
MWLAVLGPLSVRTADGEVVIAAAKQRAVLAALLVRANQVVSFGELVEVVWEDTPPPSARATLRNYVKSLRQQLGPAASRLVTRDPGYLMRLGEDELDTLRFEALCARGGTAVRDQNWNRAAANLETALSLWRGAPLADVPSEMLRRGAVPPLERLRLRAVEWRVDADLHLGRHADLLLELQALTSEHPLSEQFHAQRMLALYRCGRAAEALAAYQQARQVLAEQLGTDPGPELRRLHDRILRFDAELAEPRPTAALSATTVPPATTALSATTAPPATAVPRQLPGVPSHFVGRTAELEALGRMLAVPGRAISVIGGTAGVGKTALALHFAHQVSGRFPDGQLYANLRGFGPTGPPVTAAEVIGHFLTALGADPRRIPADLAARAALYRSMVAGRRLLVLLDNAHDAEQVRPLLPGSLGCLVLVTSRNQLTGLIASEGAQPLALDLLPEEDARELLDLRLGTERTHAEPAELAVLITLCARLPLALSIAAARAAIRPGLSIGALVAELRDSRDRLDGLETGEAASSVRAVFSWSQAGVSRTAQAMFRLLGVHSGPDISAPAAASLAGLPAAAAERALEELLSVRLIMEQVPGRFAFHDLLRAYAAEQAGRQDSRAERRAAMRRVLDHYLHTAHAADRLLIPARDPIALDGPAGQARPEALADAAHALAWFQCEHQVLLAAVRTAAADGFGTHAWRLAWTLTTFLDRQGHWTDLAAIHGTALAAAQRAGDPLGQAHAHRQLGRVRISAGSHATAERYLLSAIGEFSQAGDRVAAARTRLDIAQAFEGQGRYRDAIGHALAALEEFRAAGHLIGQARALNGIGWCYAKLGSHAQSLAYCQQALDLHRELGHGSGEAATLDSLGYAHHHLGHHAEAIECYRRSIALSQAEGDRYDEADGLSHLGDVLSDAGDLDEAFGSWRRALLILKELGHPDANGVQAKLQRVPAASA